MSDKIELSGSPAVVEQATRWLLDLDRREPTTLAELDAAWEAWRAKTLANQKDHDEEREGTYR